MVTVGSAAARGRLTEGDHGEAQPDPQCEKHEGPQHLLGTLKTLLGEAIRLPADGILPTAALAVSPAAE